MTEHQLSYVFSLSDDGLAAEPVAHEWSTRQVTVVGAAPSFNFVTRHAATPALRPRMYVPLSVTYDVNILDAKLYIQPNLPINAQLDFPTPFFQQTYPLLRMHDIITECTSRHLTFGIDSISLPMVRVRNT